MKLTKKKLFRVSLVLLASAAVSYPLLSKLHNKQALADNPPAVSGDAPPAPAAPLLALPQVPREKIILSVGNQKVTAGEFSDFFSELSPDQQQYILSHPEAKRQMADDFINVKLLANEAKAQKLDQSGRVRLAYEETLAKELLRQMGDDKAANKKYFEDNKSYFDQLKVRHILVAVQGSGVEGAKLTDAQAKAKAEELRKRIVDKHEDFASLARQESDDASSAATGGVLTVTRGRTVPTFEAASFALQKDEVSQPVKSPYGYHIIQLLDRTVPSYDDVARSVPQRRLEMLIEELKKKEKPEIDDAYFGAAVNDKPSATQPAAAADKPQSSAPPASSDPHAAPASAKIPASK